MDCEITIRPGGLPMVKTYPLLFNNILDYTNYNVEDALALYGMTLTQEFKDLNISNPTLEQLLTFVEVDNTFEVADLNKKDNQLLLDISVNNDIVPNFKDRLVNAFTVDGVFGIDLNNLRNSGLFSNTEILYLMETSQLEDVKNLYYKLQATDLDINNIVSPFKISINGRLTKINPDEFLTNVYNNYVNAQNEQDVLNMALAIQDEVVLNNPQISDQIINEIYNKQNLVTYNTDEFTGEVSKKSNNNVLVTLQQTLDTKQDFVPVLSQIEFLRVQPIEMIAGNLVIVQKYLANLEKQFADLGIDLSNLSEIVVNRNYNEVQSFLDDLYNFIVDVQNKDVESLGETLINYANTYNNFFGIQPNFKNQTVDKINDTGIFLNLETNISEEVLFNTNSVIKYNNNIYQKVNDTKTLEQLYEMIYSNSNLLPSEVYSVNITDKNIDVVLIDIDNYIESKAKELLNDNSDIEVIKKIVAYKILLGANLDNTVQKPLDNSYLQDKWINPVEFLIDFNKEMLKNNDLKALFYFSNRGLESNNVIGEYTMSQLQNILSEKMYSNLQQYALLSNNETLSNLIPQYELITTDQENILRNYYANNLEQLREESNPYQIYGTSAVIKNTVAAFTKIKNQLYEQLEPNVYELVPIEKRYRNYNLQKPELSLDNPKQYVDSISVENNIKVKTTNVENSDIEFC